VIPVGQTIAWLVESGEAPPTGTPPAQTGRRSDGGGTTPVSDRERSATAPPGDLRISPKARRLAKEHGLDVNAIAGSGPDGEIVADDIHAAIAAQSATTNRSAISNPQSSISAAARLMAERTTRSWTTVPHFFVSREVDATALTAARAKHTGGSYTDVMVSAVARALVKHPRLNASWIEDTVRLNRDVNVAIAIAIQDAVVTGVVHAADRLSLGELASRRKELTDRARAGRLQSADITGATFTVSNLGMFQVDAFTAIIVPPQAGILAVGAIADRVVAADRQPVVRPMMTLTLSCDHRVVDGLRAAAFLSDVVVSLSMADG